MTKHQVIEVIVDEFTRNMNYERQGINDNMANRAARLRYARADVWAAATRIVRQVTKEEH